MIFIPLYVFCTSPETSAAPTPETSQSQENLQDSVKFGQVTTCSRCLLEAEKKEYINGSPSDPKSEDYATTEGPPMPHLVIQTTSVSSDTGKGTERQPEKEDEAVVQSTLKGATKSSRETAVSVSMLKPAEWCLTQELRESKQDSASVLQDRFNHNCQSGKLKEMDHKVPIGKRFHCCRHELSVVAIDLADVVVVVVVLLLD